MVTRDEAVEIARTLVILGLFIAILSPFFGVVVDLVGGTTNQVRTVDNPTTDVFVDVPGDLSLTDSTRAEATLGNALFFDGNDTVTAPEPSNITNGSWTICSTVQLGDDTNLNATYDIVAYDNESILLQYDAGEWAAYYNNGTHDGMASIDAPTPRGTSGGLLSSGDPFTSVCGRYDATENELVIARDDTFSNPVALTASTTGRNVSWEWVGRQDEVRLFNRSTANSTITSYAADPIRPQPNTDRVARFMFDEGEGTTTIVYFAGVTASIDGAEWTDGVNAPDLSKGIDYELADEPLRIKVLSGGYLDGAPVVWVIRPQGGPFAAVLGIVMNIGASSLVIIGVAVILLAGAAAMDEFRGF